MTDIYSRLAGRRPRAVVQAGAVLTVGLAVALALVDHAATRALSAGAIGVVALLALKLGLVNLQRHGVPASSAAIRTGSSDLRRVVDDATAEVERLAATIDPLAERLAHHEGLARRTEPAIAEFATLRHEVLYLRETVERIRTELDN